MRTSLLAMVAAVASMASAQAVTATIKPSVANPTGCATTVPTLFGLIRTDITSSSKAKREILRRASDISVSKADAQSALSINLTNTQLTDSNGRTGAIVANYQFQFDGPPQAGTIYTAGFCILGNGSLVLGNSAVWWSCNSGGFDNLYDRDWAEQCRPILLQTFSLSDSSSSSTASGNAAVASSGSAAAVIASATGSASSKASSSGMVTSVSSGASSATTSGASSYSGSTSGASSATTGTHITGTAEAASTASAPTAATSKAAAPSGFHVPGVAIAAGIIGAALL